MSSQPLRDRLFSNSPDPLKSSILRESGMGWSSPPPDAKDSQNNGSITSPLRISKRDSPRSSTQLARRTSSSYRHVRNNNLVSKSPFKSQIPTPSTPKRPSSVVFPLTRKVSGEKRPRPQSIHEQAETENERPFALKRERRQSKGFQNLLEKEPVSKSPFRRQQYTTSSQQPPLPPLLPSPPESKPPTASAAQSPEEDTALLRDHASNLAPSPARSSLVSRRLHGPRLSGSGKRERRKTVTFLERCDVVEFAPDEDEEEEVFDSADDEVNAGGSDQQDEDDPFFRGMSDRPTQPANVDDDDASFDSIHLSDVGMEEANPSLLQLDPDVSITGLVDEMFASNAAADESTTFTKYSTPPPSANISPGLQPGTFLGQDSETGLSSQQRQQSPQYPPLLNGLPNPLQIRRPPSIPNSPSNHPFGFGRSPRASPLGQPATPRRSPAQPVAATPPLGRSTHPERVRRAKEDKVGESNVEGDARKSPLSPSPMKGPLVLGTSGDLDILVPRLDILNNNDPISRSLSGPDPFITEEDCSIIQEGDHRDDSLSLSIGNSEISLTGLGRDPGVSIQDAEKEQKMASPGRDTIMGDEPVEGLSPHPLATDGPRSSPLARDHSRSPSALNPRISSPLFRAGSPLLAGRHRSGSNSSLTSRQRITREDVHKRLLTRRSAGSPAPETDPALVGTPNIERAHISYGPTDREVQMQAAFTGSPISIQHTERIGIDSSVGSKQADLVDIEIVQENGANMKATYPVPETEVHGLAPEASTADSGDTMHKEATLDRPTSLGMLTRSPGDHLNMGSVSSGSSGNSSETAVEASGPLLKIEFKDTDMDMKSALDRLMDDVAGVGGQTCEDSMMTENESYEVTATNAARTSRAPLSRAMTEPAPLLHTSTGIGFSPDKDRSDSSFEGPPPVPPPKDNIRQREQLILEKRREMRQLEADFDEESEHSREYICPPRPADGGKNRHVEQRLLGVGRPSRRRSMSTGDAELLRAREGEGLLDGVVSENSDALADSIEKELKRLVEPQKKAKYQVREREGTIYASSSDPDGVTHMSGPGDVNVGKAWRTVRRPSDMNEYSKLIKEYRAQDKSGKTYGKVFVKILGIRNMHLPLPQQATLLTCTLNNGIHFVTTPECQLDQSTRIDQEFELIEHSKLEFTLTLKVKRDAHIIAQFKALAPPPAPPTPLPVVQAPPKSGMRSFFSSSPKKAPKEKVPVQPPPIPVHRLPENLARYMKPDGTLARAFVAFKDVAGRCDTRLFETSYPLIGQRLETGGKFSTQQVGELVLQIFRLPPLPGISPDQLPQSLDECCRGLRHLNWHKVTYFEGTLTQYGGGCMTWKRRRFRVIGANLVAFNDVTKKATATIDLKKAVAVEDDQQGRGTAMSPTSGRTTRYDDYLCGVERSFRLIFPDNDEIVFFADSDEEKTKWLEIFTALVGHIPPHPLWGEMLWQRQEELSKRAAVQVLSQAHSPST